MSQPVDPSQSDREPSSLPSMGYGIHGSAPLVARA